MNFLFQYDGNFKKSTAICDYYKDVLLVNIIEVDILQSVFH